VPYVGATLKEACQQFCDVLNRVLNTTITKARLLELGAKDRPNDPRQVAFRQAGQPATAPLNTKFGPMNLYIGQLCDSVEVKGGGRQLFTTEYQYTLTLEGQPNALLRWEYTRTPPDGGLWCRHHLQGPVEIPLGRGGAVSLNDLHLPTGYVTIEEVIRFCIVDLEAKVVLSSDWHAILTESYEKFRVEEGKL
jgi:hypothetical protein